MNTDFEKKEVYLKGFPIEDLFQLKASGIETRSDSVLIGFNMPELITQVEIFLQANKQWNAMADPSTFKTVTYRPFDERVIYINRDVVDWPGLEQLDSSLLSTYSLVLGKQTKEENVSHFFMTNTLSNDKTAESTTGSLNFPLYIYNEDDETSEKKSKRAPNLNPDIIKKIGSALYLTFTNEKEAPAEGEVCFAHSEEVRPEFRLTFAPLDLLDYIYAILYSPNYRKKYNTFLKMDFPRIPYPEDSTKFWHLSNLGGELRQIHLLKNLVKEKLLPPYPVEGDNEVEQIRFEGITEIVEGKTVVNQPAIPHQMEGRVYINASQYFDFVPEKAWNFSIGGYQPAQEWLKDRRGRKLNEGDILHYQKIIVALTETNRIMAEIDKV